MQYITRLSDGRASLTHKLFCICTAFLASLSLFLECGLTCLAGTHGACLPVCEGLLPDVLLHRAGLGWTGLGCAGASPKQQTRLFLLSLKKDNLLCLCFADTGDGDDNTQGSGFVLLSLKLPMRRSFLVLLLLFFFCLKLRFIDRANSDPLVALQ